MSFGSEAPGTALAESKRPDEQIDMMLKACRAVQDMRARGGAGEESRRLRGEQERQGGVPLSIV
jgi:hypothetical protein